jgi:hypothetical protein
MTEQAVKDKISLEMPDWKKIQSGQNVAITIDAQALYQAERGLLQGWVNSKEIDKIIARYPIRETQALTAIASALQFKSRAQYEAAARKLVTDDKAIKAYLVGHFGGLSAAMA